MGAFIEHCTEIPGECVERTNLYSEAISAYGMARFAWPRAKRNPTVLAPEDKGTTTS